jgi:hypothetical protein
MADAERFYRIGLAKRAKSIAYRTWESQSQPGDEPDDVAQHLLLTAWETFVKHEGESDDTLQRYVSKACSHRASDSRRKAARRGRRRASVQAEELLAQLDLGPPPMFEDDQEDK